MNQAALNYEASLVWMRFFGTYVLFIHYTHNKANSRVRLVETNMVTICFVENLNQ